MTKQLSAMLTSKIKAEPVSRLSHIFVMQVRKLQEERDWLQEQIEPGSVEKTNLLPEAAMQLPVKPPVRHLSL